MMAWPTMETFKRDNSKADKPDMGCIYNMAIYFMSIGKGNFIHFILKLYCDDLKVTLF